MWVIVISSWSQSTETTSVLLITAEASLKTRSLGTDGGHYSEPNITATKCIIQGLWRKSDWFKSCHFHLFRVKSCRLWPGEPVITEMDHKVAIFIATLPIFAVFPLTCRSARSPEQQQQSSVLIGYYLWHVANQKVLWAEHWAYMRWQRRDYRDGSIRAKSGHFYMNLSYFQIELKRISYYD